MTSHTSPCCRAHAMLLKPGDFVDPHSPFPPGVVPDGYVAMKIGGEGTFLIKDDRTERLADFSATMCSWSMFLTDESAFMHVIRHGQCFDFEITQAEQKSGSWVLERLGAEAAASVPRYTALVGVILHFSSVALEQYSLGEGGNS